jgi:hypothetical protein
MSESFEDQLATAFVAKMAGMTLKSVDDSTIQRSGAPATRIDPASFLTAIQDRKKQEQQRQADELNKIAEQMYPLPQPIQPLPPIEPLPPLEPLPPSPVQIVDKSVTTSELVEVLKSIDSSIKELVNHFKQT